MGETTRSGLLDLSLNLGTQIGSDYLNNYIQGAFGDSDVARVFGTTISSGINATTNTLASNLAKGSALYEGLSHNLGSSLAGTGVGLASGYIGKGITSAMGNSAVGKGIGTGIGTALGGIGSTVVSNLFNGEKAFAGLGLMTKATSSALEAAKKVKDVAKIADIAGKAKFTNWANWGGLAASAVGTGLSAAFGPSKIYNGKYGTGALIADAAYDAVQTAAGFFGPVGSLISGGMALNKGLTNAFGSTDGMTLQDTIVGSSWTGLLTGGIPFLNWINMAGARKTGTFNNLSWQNTERTNAFMQDAFGDLPENFDKAREEAGKTYGLFSRSAYNKALKNLDYANNAWNTILGMTDLNEIQNIRSQYMSSINNLRYLLNIYGGWNPVYRGKQGMKIFNNATNHKIGMRLLSGAALVDSKQMILSFYGGGTTYSLLSNLSKEEILNLLNTLINLRFLSGVGDEAADGILGPKTKNAYIKYLNSKKPSREVKASLMSTSDIANYENKINNLSNEEIINTYHLTNQTHTPYLVDDKVNNKLKVYIDGNLIREYDAIHGKYSTSSGNTFLKKVKSNGEYVVKFGDFLGKIAKELGIPINEIVRLNNITNPNFIKVGQVLKLPGYKYETTEVNPDEMTITYVDNKGLIVNKAGNLTTPAGIYFSSRAKNNYHGSPSFIRRTQLQVESKSYAGIPSSIHVRDIVQGANTNGCTGISTADMLDLSNLLTGYENVPTYILPADNRNKFKIRNNKLIFKSLDVSKTPSHNEFDYTSISKLKYSNKNLNLELNRIIKGFSSSLIKHKQELQKDLGINNDTYTELAKYALGILGVETNYGDRHSAVGNFFRGISKFINKNNSSPDYYAKYHTYNASRNNNSVGLTLMRMLYLGEKEKELFKKYNISKENLVNNPEKAAIATMIKLASEFKNRGNNFNRAISSWNNRSNYIDRVKEASKRFNIYLRYSTLKN